MIEDILELKLTSNSYINTLIRLLKSEKIRIRYKKEDISMQLIAIPGLTLPNTGGGYTGPLKLSVKFILKIFFFTCICAIIPAVALYLYS